MTTHLSLILGKCFKQRDAPSALLAFFAAFLFGLAIPARSAVAQLPPVCTHFEGTSGPTVTVLINGVQALTSAGQPAVLSLARNPATNAPLVDSAGNQYVDLTGFYVSSDTPPSASFEIDPTGGPDAPRVFLVAPTSGGVALMVASDMLAISDGPTAGKLTLMLDSNDTFGSCPGGTHTYGVTIDGKVLATSAVIEVTGRAVLGSEQTDVINLIPPVPGPDAGPSLSAGTVASPLRAGGRFSGAVPEDIVCGNIELNCFLQIRNQIDLTYANAGDAILALGSFGAGVVTKAGAGNASLLLGATGVPFNQFQAKAATQPWWNAFEVGALFTLGPLSRGLNPPVEAFKLRLGDFSATLPPGSFKKYTYFGTTFYLFEGIVDGRRFAAQIVPRSGGKIALFAEGQGADITSSPAFLDLEIGADKGGTAAPVCANIFEVFDVNDPDCV